AMIEIGFYDLVTVSYNFRSDEKLTKELKKARKKGIAVVAMKNMGGGGGKGFDAGIEGLNHFQSGLRWVMNQDFVDTTIPGMRSFQHVEENFSVMGTTMSWSDRKILHKYAEATDAYYCRRCGECTDVCPYGTNVSDVMRYLMYADGYGEYQLGGDSYNKLRVSEQAANCAECDKCLVPCGYGLDIKERMVRAHSLFV
ncbi:4Fe-4S dicluster domain-containing protein, partial [bacterium]|nr:4Fe-4S dicluster domain-containing protein [bacterium]